MKGILCERAEDLSLESGDSGSITLIYVSEAKVLANFMKLIHNWMITLLQFGCL